MSDHCICNNTLSKDIVSCAMMMKIKNTRVMERVQEIQLVCYGTDKGTIKMKYHRRKKCKCEQYNHNAWSQDLMKNMGLGETNIYTAWYVMCKLMINEHQNICLCLLEWCQCSLLKLSGWSNNAENMVESEGLANKRLICNCFVFIGTPLHTFLDGAMASCSTHFNTWQK